MKRYSPYIFTLLAASGCAIGCTRSQQRDFENMVGTPAERQAVLDKAERGAEDFVEDVEDYFKGTKKQVEEAEKKTAS